MSTRTAIETRQYAVAGGIADEALTCLRTVLAFNGQQREIDRWALWRGA